MELYWLVLFSWFWGGTTFGEYHNLAECEKAGESTPWYVSADCIPVPDHAKYHPNAQQH